MVSHSIPLTRDNINKIRSVLQFNEKVNFDPDEVNKFIEKYVAGKNIDINSSEGRKIQDTLTKFFEQFKNMSEDDIFMFIENNIDFSTENIESFNKLFKGNSSIEKILMDIQEKLNNIDLDKDFIESINSKISMLDKQETQNVNKGFVDTASQSLASKIYADNNPMNTKVDVLDLLKTLASNNSEESKSMSNVNQDNISENINKSLADKLQDKSFFNEVKSIIGNINTSEEIPKTQASSLIESTNKAKIEDLLSRTEGREVKLSDDEYKMIKEAVSKYKGDSSDESFPQKAKSTPLNTFNIKNMNTQFSGADKFKGFNISREDAIKENIQEKINSVKTINLGEIDGYITLKNNKLDVNLKCDPKFSDIINNHKAQLSNGLSSLGLLANVNVSVKERPVDISNCREFFSDVTISAIDTKV